jgi:hypothetical protein
MTNATSTTECVYKYVQHVHSYLVCIMWMQLLGSLVWHQHSSLTLTMHQQKKTYLFPLITSYSLLKSLILGVRRG